MNMKRVFASVFAALLIICPVRLIAFFFNNGELILYSELTDDGKKFTLPIPGHPVFYLPVSGGFQERGGIVAGEKSPSKAEVEKLVVKTLASQGYFQTDKDHPSPALFIT